MPIRTAGLRTSFFVRRPDLPVDEGFDKFLDLHEEIARNRRQRIDEKYAARRIDMNDGWTKELKIQFKEALLPYTVEAFDSETIIPLEDYFKSQKRLRPFRILSKGSIRFTTSHSAVHWMPRRTVSSSQDLAMFQSAVDEECPIEIIKGFASYLFGHSTWKLAKKDWTLSREELTLVFRDTATKERRKFERLRMSHSDTPSASRRSALSDEVKIFVWRRDGGKCVKCGSNERLEYDHIIPVIKGGSDTERNIQLLCEGCNRSKGGNL